MGVWSTQAQESRGLKGQGEVLLPSIPSACNMSALQYSKGGELETMVLIIWFIINKLVIIISASAKEQ